MPSRMALIALATSLTALSCYLLTREWWSRSSRKRLCRSLLPHDLTSWRHAGGHESDSQYPDPWAIMHDSGFWEELGYRLWLRHSRISRILCAQQKWGPPKTTLGHHFLENPRDMTLVHIKNALIRPARHSVGFEVVVRVLSAGNQGSSEIQILRQLATGKHILQPSNHVLPMFQEIGFEDITFGIFPYVSTCVLDVFDTGTVGEMINYILQMLEAAAYIHQCFVAHQDLFLDNFLIEYQPRAPAPATVLPRLYLIDFETAVSFPADSRSEDRLVHEHPFGDDFSRPLAPELKDKGVPFDPFALDVWQMAYKMIPFSTTSAEIDDILQQMCADDPVTRPTAQKAYESITNVYRRIPPVELDGQVVQPPIDFSKEPLE